MVMADVALKVDFVSADAASSRLQVQQRPAGFIGRGNECEGLAKDRSGHIVCRAGPRVSIKHLGGPYGFALHCMNSRRSLRW